MANLEERLFFRGANSDDELRSIPQGDYLLDETYNIRIYDSETNSVGVIKNIKGNALVSFVLPAGQNKSIGSFSDKDTGNVYYFIKNSLGNHGIYKFSQPNTIEEVYVDPLLNFTDERINHWDLVDGKLLYWTNKSNPPRKINIEKALEGKNRIYRTYFGLSSGTGETYTFSIFDPSGALSFTWNITVPVPAPGTIADSFYVAHYIATNSPAGPYTLEAIGPFLQLVMSNVGKYTMTATCNISNQVMAVAENFYPSPRKEDFIDRLKYPFVCEPTVSYKIDSTRETNFIKEKVFQFATQYVYDDNEFSSISPISVIASYGNTCTQNIQVNLANYIEIDFTEARLNDPSVRSIIKYVNVYFREHNDGKFKLIRTLTPDEFGIGRNVLNFYNDALYPVLADSVANTLYSSVPIISGAQEFIGKKIVDSDITEGYDPVNVDVELNTTYGQSPPTGFTISGRVFIVSQGDRTSGYPKQPIMNKNLPGDVEGPVFGGLKEPGISPDPQIVDVSGRYYQSIPLNGFVFYLAGTDYYGVSKQNPTGLAFQDAQTGVLNINNQSEADAAMNYMYSTGFSSNWKIEGIPPGIYSLRVASHLTTQGDLLNGTRNFQRTSTTIYTANNAYGTNAFPDRGVVSVDPVNGKTEAIIEILSNGTVKVYDPDSFALIYSSSNGALHDTSIADISLAMNYSPTFSVYFYQSQVAIGGYLTDTAGNASPTNIAQIMALERVTRTDVGLKLTTRFYANPTDTISYKHVFTDHNGFWYFGGRHYDFSDQDHFGVKIIDIVDYTNAVITLGSAIPLHDFGNFANTFTQNNQQFRLLMGASFYGGTFYISGRTFISGTITDGTNPIPNITVAIAYRGTARTDAQGNYSISFYSYVGGNTGIVMASSSGLCFFGIIPSPRILAPFLIGNSNFNNNNHFTGMNFTAILLYLIAGNAFKRGGDWQMGIVYYDRGLRSTTVNANEKSNLHVNFYTELLNGNTLPSGIPTVSWKIRHLPPSWATHWQWVKTKNLQLNNQIEWLANSVRYTDKPTAAGTSTSYALGVYLAINLDNIQTYYDTNAMSQVAYTWQPGDRIRFIRDAGGALYSQYFDFEVVNFDSTSNEIFILKDFSFPQVAAGVNFELYSPRPKTENKLFFEMGECYEVKESGGIKYHATDNPSNDQNPLNPYNQPATGIFKTGDAYYRIRRIPYGANQRNVFIDDQSISDFYSSKDDNIGRVNILDLTFGQINRIKTLRWSGDYIDNLKVNDLSWNLPNDTEDILKGEGPVNKLQVAGRVLLAMQGAQVSSVYIYESQFLDNTGTQNVLKADSFIGSINPLKKLSGTIHPESVREFEGEVYYYDALKGLAVRYANDGQTAISDYKANAFIKNKAKTYSGPVLGFIDPKNKEYGLTFDETVVFCDQEGSRRWISKYRYAAEYYAYSNMELISFKDGELWVHERNPIHNNFFGVQYNSEIAFVSNENNAKIRNFMALVVDGSDVWFSPNAGDITIPPSVAYPTGMSSRLLKTKFRRVATDWYADFAKDLNTPNKPNPIVNGRDLVGHVIKIKLINDSLDEVSLKSVSVRYIFNEFTKQ